MRGGYLRGKDGGILSEMVADRGGDRASKTKVSDLSAESLRV